MLVFERSAVQTWRAEGCVFSLANFSPDQLDRKKGTWLSMLMYHVRAGSVICGCC